MCLRFLKWKHFTIPDTHRNVAGGTGGTNRESLRAGLGVLAIKLRSALHTATDTAAATDTDTSGGQEKRAAIAAIEKQKKYKKSPEALLMHFPLYSFLARWCGLGLDLGSVLGWPSLATFSCDSFSSTNFPRRLYHQARKGNALSEILIWMVPETWRKLPWDSFLFEIALFISEVEKCVGQGLGNKWIFSNLIMSKKEICLLNTFQNIWLQGHTITAFIACNQN